MRDLRFAADAPRRQFAHSVQLSTRNSLAKGIVVAITPVAGLSALDVAKGQRFSPKGGMSLDILDGQICWESNTASTDSIEGSTTGLVGYPLCFGLVFVPGSLGTNVNLFGFSNSGSVASRNKVGLRIGTSTVDAYILSTTGTSGVSSSSAAPTVGKRNVAVAVFESAAKRYVVLNGEAGTINTTSITATGFDTVSVGKLPGLTTLSGQVGGYAAAFVWRRLLSLEEARSFCADPEQLFNRSQQSWLLGVVASVAYTFSVSGQIVFSGATALRRERKQVVSGGIAFSAAAALLHVRAFLPSGSISFTGSAAQTKIKVIAPAGSILFSGSAPFASTNTFTFSVSGSLAFSGAASQLRVRQLLPAGAINFSGAVQPAHVKAFAVNGNILFSGAASLRRTRVTAPNGQITFSGNSGMTFIPFGAPTTATISKISIGVNRTNRLS